MEINIKVSQRMDEENLWVGSDEKRFIRLPESLRVKYQMPVGVFINVKTKTGDTISLIVNQAYKDDVEKDNTVAYITTEVFNLLGIEDAKSNVQLIEGITLGCDPEFFLITRDKGELVHASTFVKKWGPIGYDGIMMEIRPLPSPSEHVVVNNMYNLLTKARQQLTKANADWSSKIAMVAASNIGTFAAGFHLHYGLPPQLLGRRPGVKALSYQIVKALDFYVGIPSIIPESAEDAKRRTAPYSPYGKPGGVRLDHRTLEYRTPGGYHLRHPELTAGLMGLGAIVVEDLVSRIREYTNGFMALQKMTTADNLNELYPNVPDIHELFRVVCSIDAAPARSKMETIVKDVRDMISYERRAASVERFFDYILTDKAYNRDIEYNWNNYFSKSEVGKNEGQSGKMVVL